jgi:hypothetical protein
MIALVLLQDDKWIDYCKAFHPNAPCTLPPGASATVLITLICIVFGLLIAATAIHHAVTRLRIVNAQEFTDLNECLIDGLGLFSEFKGRELRSHCHLVSLHLVQVTLYIARHVSLCVDKYHSLPNEQVRLSLLLDLLEENRKLKNRAIFIAFISSMPFLAQTTSRRTHYALNFYSTRWLPMVKTYALEFPECR